MEEKKRKEKKKQLTHRKTKQQQQQHQQQKNAIQPTQDPQTGMYPKESVLSTSQLPSGIASLFLDMRLARCHLAVTTISTWFWPKKDRP